MARHIPVSQFKDHASEFVAAAERGEEIVITRHGRPTAVLRPASRPDADQESRARAALARMAARRARMRAAGRTATVEEMIAWKNEGQR